MAKKSPYLTKYCAQNNHGRCSGNLKLKRILTGLAITPCACGCHTERITTLKGIISGDHECWCILVDLETFLSLRNEKPMRYDVGPFAKKGNPYRYKIYPDDLGLGASGKLMNVRIEVKEVK